MLSTIPAGSKITRRYYTIPTHYTTGEDFGENWNAVVAAAREQYAAAIENLRESLGGFASEEEIERTAKNAVQVTLRWYITYPDAEGSVDVEVERYTDVTVLRTSADFPVRT